VSDDPDRRELVLAVVNCQQHGVQGNADDVPTVAYLRVFLTEPVPEPPDSDYYFEDIDVLRPGVNDDVLKDLVQLYR
jgi:hypothetical protein